MLATVASHHHLLCFFLDQTAAPLYAMMAAVALCVPFVPLFQKLAAYGKTRIRNDKNDNDNDDVNCSLRSLVRALNRPTVCKSYFTHFYTTGIISLTFRIFMIYLQQQQQQHQAGLEWEYRSSSVVLVALLLMLHLCRRLLECLFVHQWRQGSQMHLAAYVAGIVYYTWLPYVFFPVEQDEARSSKLAEAHQRSYISWLILSLLCLWSQYQQYRHHVILANLRPKNSSNSNKPITYQIPRDGWFQFITCPHYTAEILLYVSLCSLDNHAVCRKVILMVWVITTLTVTALDHRAWYARNSPNECLNSPKRWAILPYFI